MRLRGPHSPEASGSITRALSSPSSQTPAATGAPTPPPVGQAGGFDYYKNEFVRPFSAGISLKNTAGAAVPMASPAGKWAKAIPVVEQNGAKDCGPAAVAMLMRGLGQGQGLSDSELVSKIGSDSLKRNGIDISTQGTRPRTMVDMLNAANMQVVGVGVDASQMDQYLNNGNKLVAQIDADSNSATTGDAHWVVVDGKDAQGNYSVKDPIRGAITMTAQELQQGFDAQNRDRAWGGGFMAVDPTSTTGLSSAQVEQILGDDPTIGFNSTKVGTEVAY